MEEGSPDDIRRGTLLCSKCGRSYPIREGIPRFVETDEDYAGNFSLQWTRFRRTQIDAYSGIDHSERRFRSETGWSPEDVMGRLMLDCGCGAGRFSAVSSSWGGRVVAVDLSAGAVEACALTLAELGHAADVVQASIYRLPFRPASFDLLFSLGVLQHTPDPIAAARALPRFLSPGGRLAYWVYERRPSRYLLPRTYIRALTRRLPLGINMVLSRILVAVFFPVTLLLSLVPGLRRLVPLAPISARHYWGHLSVRQQWEWTLLDTFDSYAARYEEPLEESALRHALEAEGMADVQRHPAAGLAMSARRGGPAGLGGKRIRCA